MTSAIALAEATPASRDRYVDLLRVASLGVVVVGHWLMAVILVGQDGAITATNALVLVPWLQPLTWVLQVMPVFFFVGGFSHFIAWTSIERRGGGYADFVRTRAGRLLRPTAVFVSVWLALALLIEATGHDEGVLRLATGTVGQPLWFVGVYLAVVALAPAMLTLHRRLDRWAPAVPTALAAGAGAVDLARFSGSVPAVGYLNVALIWLAVHQLGFFYADGSLLRGGRSLALTLAGVGLAGTLILVALGPYPVSMVGVPGESVSNMAPPTLALMAQSVFITGLVLLLRERLTRWLNRPRVWVSVVNANGLAMTAFLWHLSAMFTATALTASLGLIQQPVGSVRWWLLRPLWYAILALLTAGLVMAFRRADQPRATPVLEPGTPTVVAWRTMAAASGVTLCVIGVLGLSAAGFGGLLTGRGADFAIISVTPLFSSVTLASGAVLLRASQLSLGGGRKRMDSDVDPAAARGKEPR